MICSINIYIIWNVCLSFHHTIFRLGLKGLLRAVGLIVSQPQYSVARPVSLLPANPPGTCRSLDPLLDPESLGTW